jgi:hypothetical protein
MTRNRTIGLGSRDGFDVGRDPRSMSMGELEQLGHARLSPVRALRLRCLDCCNGSAQEVRLCTAVDCPSWPFRMGRNPWRTPLDDQERAQRADRMKRNRAAASTSPEKTQGQIDASPSDGARVPERPTADISSTEKDEDEGGAS